MTSTILLLGSTGFTGRLIARYLLDHPQSNQFNLILCSRSLQKLENVFPNHANQHLVIDDDETLTQAIDKARVVINTIGPFWLHSTDIVRLCAVHGTHYVDLTGETHWIRSLILQFDLMALKSHAIIVPSCGYDSIPSDTVAYLSAKTLITSSNKLPGNSTTLHSCSGGISGGTVATFLSVFQDVPLSVLDASSKPYSISPIVGPTTPSPIKFIYSLSTPYTPTFFGSFFPMAPSNRAIVQRTFGLFELENNVFKYGPHFTYDEFLFQPSKRMALIVSSIIFFVFALIVIKPLRLIAKLVLPKPGQGPPDSQLHSGFFKATNITASADSVNPTYVQSTLEGKGDPGYFLSAIMISECALAIILNESSLSPLAKKGGILTPMSAFGDLLIQRLEATGRFHVDSHVLNKSK